MRARRFEIVGRVVEAGTGKGVGGVAEFIVTVTDAAGDSGTQNFAHVFP